MGPLLPKRDNGHIMTKSVMLLPPAPPGDMLLSNYVTCKHAANLTDTLGEPLPPLQYFQMCPLVVHSRHSHRSLRPHYTAPLHPVTSSVQKWIRVRGPTHSHFQKGEGLRECGWESLAKRFQKLCGCRLFDLDF